MGIYKQAWSLFSNDRDAQPPSYADFETATGKGAALPPLIRGGRLDFSALAKLPRAPKLSSPAPAAAPATPAPAKPAPAPAPPPQPVSPSKPATPKTAAPAPPSAPEPQAFGDQDLKPGYNGDPVQPPEPPQQQPAPAPQPVQGRQKPTDKAPGTAPASGAAGTQASNEAETSPEAQRQSYRKSPEYKAWIERERAKSLKEAEAQGPGRVVFWNTFYDELLAGNDAEVASQRAYAAESEYNQKAYANSEHGKEARATEASRQQREQEATQRREQAEQVRQEQADIKADASERIVAAHNGEYPVDAHEKAVRTEVQSQLAGQRQAPETNPYGSRQTSAGQVSSGRSAWAEKQHRQLEAVKQSSTAQMTLRAQTRHWITVANNAKNNGDMETYFEIVDALDRAWGRRNLGQYARWFATARNELLAYRQKQAQLAG